MFFKEHSIVDHCLGCGYVQINNSVIHCLCGLNGRRGRRPPESHMTITRLTSKVPRLSSRSAYKDHTFSDMYNLFCTGSVCKEMVVNRHTPPYLQTLLPLPYHSKWPSWLAQLWLSGEAVGPCCSFCFMAEERGYPRGWYGIGTYSCLSSISTYSHHTVDKSSTFLNCTFVAFSNMMLLCIERKGN